MTEIEDKELQDYLGKQDIDYIQHEHPPVFTVEESKTLKQNIPGLHTKSLFLKTDKKNYYLVCMPAEKRLDIKSLRKKLGAKKLHFASPEELKAELNLTPGSVSIFGMIYAKSTHLIIDREVWTADIVSFHPNINTATLEINREDLEKFYNSLKSEKEIMEL